MKTIYLSLLALCLLTFSCKKENEETLAEQSTKGSKVTFNISEFTQTVDEMSTNKKNGSKLMATSTSDTSSLSDKITEIYYLVYDSTGKQIRSYRSPVDFYTETGSDLDEPIVDFLQPGKYTFVFVGAKGKDTEPWEQAIEVTGFNMMSDAPYMNARLTFPWGLMGPHSFSNMEDIFVEQFELTVGEGSLEKDVVLKRIVSKLEIVIEDAIPDNVSFLDIAIPDALAEFKFSTKIPSYRVGEDEEGRPNTYAYYTLTAEEKGKANHRITLYLLNNKDFPVDVFITARDSAHNTLSTKTASNIILETNKKTILTGRLFNSNSPGFHITVDDKWDTDSIEVPF